MAAIAELLLEFGRENGGSESLPPRCHGAGKLSKEVLNTTGAAAKVIEENLTHDAPSQPWSPTQRRIDVGHADHPVANKVVDLSHQRRLQPICNVPRQFLVKAHGTLAQCGIEFRSTLNRVFGGFCTADDF